MVSFCRLIVQGFEYKMLCIQIPTTAGFKKRTSVRKGCDNIIAESDFMPASIVFKIVVLITKPHKDNTDISERLEIIEPKLTISIEISSLSCLLQSSFLTSTESRSNCSNRLQHDSYTFRWKSYFSSMDIEESRSSLVVRSWEISASSSKRTWRSSHDPINFDKKQEQIKI